MALFNGGSLAPAFPSDLILHSKRCWRSPNLFIPPFRNQSINPIISTSMLPHCDLQKRINSFSKIKKQHMLFMLC